RLFVLAVVPTWGPDPGATAGTNAGTNAGPTAGEHQYVMGCARPHHRADLSTCRAAAKPPQSLCRLANLSPLGPHPEGSQLPDFSRFRTPVAAAMWRAQSPPRAIAA